MQKRSRISDRGGQSATASRSSPAPALIFSRPSARRTHRGAQAVHLRPATSLSACTHHRRYPRVMPCSCRPTTSAQDLRVAAIPCSRPSRSKTRTRLPQAGLVTGNATSGTRDLSPAPREGSRRHARRIVAGGSDRIDHHRGNDVIVPLLREQLRRAGGKIVTCSSSISRVRCTRSSRRASPVMREKGRTTDRERGSAPLQRTAGGGLARWEPSASGAPWRSVRWRVS